MLYRQNTITTPFLYAHAFLDECHKGPLTINVCAIMHL
jgi:hypothetical protein